MKLYRKLCDTGGSVILAHHKSDKSEALYRGSSALRAGIDMAWYLSRDDEALTENLKRATLTAFKTRDGSRPALRLNFENGMFHSLDTPSRAPVHIIVEFVYSHPGSCQKDLISLGKRQGISEHGVQAALQTAVLDRRIELRQKRPRATARYYPPEGRPEAATSTPILSVVKRT